jgi:hypothetical protein
MNKHTVTTPEGILKRNSAKATYTHCVVGITSAADLIKQFEARTAECMERAVEHAAYRGPWEDKVSEWIAAEEKRAAYFTQQAAAVTGDVYTAISWHTSRGYAERAASAAEGTRFTHVSVRDTTVTTSTTKGK